MKPLRNELDYEEALYRVEQIWNADSGMELDEHEVLVTLIKKYESVF